MRVSFIGSGNVATHLALALFDRGNEIGQVWSRNIDHASLLASRVSADPISKLSALAGDADVYVVAVSDDVLFSLANDIRVNNALVLHTSGATPKEVLKYCSRRYGVLWSPQSFVRDMALDYSGLPFCIEGCDSKTEEDIEAFASLISPHVYRTDLKQRQYLHLSAVFVNNFTNGLYGVAQRICREQNVPFEVLHPLILNTANKVTWGDVRYQLTGPAVREDHRTLDAHRRLLAGEPYLLDLYDRLTDLVVKVKAGEAL